MVAWLTISWLNVMMVLLPHLLSPLPREARIRRSLELDARSFSCPVRKRRHAPIYPWRRFLEDRLSHSQTIFGIIHVARMWERIFDGVSQSSSDNLIHLSSVKCKILGLTPGELSRTPLVITIGSLKFNFDYLSIGHCSSLKKYFNLGIFEGKVLILGSSPIALPQLS